MSNFNISPSALQDLAVAARASQYGYFPSSPENSVLDGLAQKDPDFAQLLRGYREQKLRGGQDQTQEGDPWKAYTLVDAFQERPPLQYVAGKLFELPSLNIVYGAPGTLKSFFLQDLAVCVASGLEWLPPAPWKNSGERGIITLQAPVMWLDFDNGARRTHNRFEALARARSLTSDIPLTYFSMPSPWLSATNADSMRMLANRIKDKGTKLVITDNLGNVSGDADENSSEMGFVMSQFRQVAEETGAAITLIHHQRKSNGTNSRAGDALRGHSSIEAAADLALLVEREPFSETITIRATKMRGAEILPFGAQFTFLPKDDNDLLESRFFGLEGDDNESAAAIRREILAALPAGIKRNKTELTDEVKRALAKVGRNRIREMIERMANDGLIQSVPGERTEKMYFK